MGSAALGGGCPWVLGAVMEQGGERLAWVEEASSASQGFPVASFGSKRFRPHSWLFICNYYFMFYLDAEFFVCCRARHGSCKGTAAASEGCVRELGTGEPIRCHWVSLALAPTYSPRTKGDGFIALRAPAAGRPWGSSCSLQ